MSVKTMVDAGPLPYVLSCLSSTSSCRLVCCILRPECLALLCIYRVLLCIDTVSGRLIECSLPLALVLVLPPILSQSFLWPIPHFYHLFVTLQLSEEKNKSWSGSFNRLQSHAAAPFMLRGFEPGRRRITICTLYTDKVVHMGENQKAVSWLVYCLSLDFKISTGVGSSSPCDPDCRRKRPHGGWTSTGIGLTIVQQSQPKNNKQVN